MALVEVDVIHAQAAQAGVALLHDVLAREAAVVGPLAHGEENLRRQHVRVAREVLERPADQLFSPAPAVLIGRVEEVDAQVVGPVDAGDGGPVFHRATVGQPAPQADRAHAHPGAP